MYLREKHLMNKRNMLANNWAEDLRESSAHILLTGCICDYTSATSGAKVIFNLSHENIGIIILFRLYVVTNPCITAGCNDLEVFIINDFIGIYFSI